MPRRLSGTFLAVRRLRRRLSATNLAIAGDAVTFDHRNLTAGDDRSPKSLLDDVPDLADDFARPDLPQAPLDLTQPVIRHFELVMVHSRQASEKLGEELDALAVGQRKDLIDEGRSVSAHLPAVDPVSLVV